MRFLFFATVVALFVGTSASANEQATLGVEVAPVITDGKLQGCAINFDAIRQDPEYSQGESVYLSGSLDFWAFSSKPPAFSLKLGVRPLGGSKSAFERPADAYLMNGLASNVAERVSAFDGETAGFRIFSFTVGAEGLKTIENVGRSGQLKFGYAMVPGRIAAPVTVDLRIKRLDLDDPSKSETAPNAPSDWLNCIDTAVKARKAELRRDGLRSDK
jgi:hypothetical protein